MDTREKIVAPDAVGAPLANDEWIAVEGFFDPLTATQARRLAGLCRGGRKLLVIILPGDNPLLGADARAALVAALRCVDAVTVASSAREVVPFNSRIDLIEDAVADAARSAELVSFVLARQRTLVKS